MWQRGKQISKRDWTLLRVAVVACVNDVYYGRLFFGDPDTQEVMWDTDVRPSDATFLALKVCEAGSSRGECGSAQGRGVCLDATPGSTFLPSGKRWRKAKGVSWSTGSSSKGSSLQGSTGGLCDVEKEFECWSWARWECLGQEAAARQPAGAGGGGADLCVCRLLMVQG